MQRKRQTNDDLRSRFLASPITITSMKDKGPIRPTDASAKESFSGLTDVQIQPSWLRHRIAFAAAYIALLIASVVGFCYLVSGSFSNEKLFVEVILVSSIITLYLVHSRSTAKWERRAIDQSIQNESASSVLSYVEGGLWDSGYVQSRLTKSTARLARLGEGNQTIRYWWSKPQRPVVPILQPFEPKMLDETDSAFAEFRSASVSLERSELFEEHSQGSSENIMRTLRRNWIVWCGGWIGSLFLVIQFIKECGRALALRSVTPWLVIEGSIIVAIVSMLFRTTGMAKRQWLLVPGGFLRRSASFGTTSSKLRVFDRRNCVLCLYQRGRHSWIVAVADSTESDSTIVTTPEMEMLLQAWFSPLEPPGVEKLSDLV